METSMAAPLLTPIEHQSYVDELDRLREVRDRDLPELLRAARAFVANDAAEEIIQIQQDRAVVDARIARLEELVRTARIVDGGGATDVVALGRAVEVEYVRTGRVATYRVAGIASASGAGTVSAGSPVGSALLGRAVGDTVAVELPNGRVEELRIVDVLDAAP
jgi:transcription elongation factor GreA